MEPQSTDPVDSLKYKLFSRYVPSPQATDRKSKVDDFMRWQSGLKDLLTPLNDYKCRFVSEMLC
jgi:hypothetical protein